MMAWKPKPQSRLSQDKEPVDEESVEEETAADVQDGESVQELTAGLAGRQLGIAKLTEDEDEEGLPGALPSQPERGHCPAEGSTRHSERERRTSGKFLNCCMQFGSNTAGGQFTDFTEGTDDVVLTCARNTEAVAKNLQSATDASKRRSGWIHWKKTRFVPKPLEENIVDWQKISSSRKTRPATWTGSICTWWRKAAHKDVASITKERTHR